MQGHTHCKLQESVDQYLITKYQPRLHHFFLFLDPFDNVVHFVTTPDHSYDPKDDWPSMRCLVYERNQSILYEDHEGHMRLHFIFRVGRLRRLTKVVLSVISKSPSSFGHKCGHCKDELANSQEYKHAKQSCCEL